MEGERCAVCREALGVLDGIVLDEAARVDADEVSAGASLCESCHEKAVGHDD